ncbi:hypothetical protein HW555_012691 [Spodoptera exigua]|uniref:Peptidase aspartic putative domain-containing protein n=1 Tax=Spodoptera exigua TaxID=7107 RepID=A0A835G710_SPOEX|nr:hypothetical protein HW555_012691 [Spodoptera exigua]
MTLLATALVQVTDEDGHNTVLRALIDQGSQANFVSERAAQLLKAKRTRIKGTITGVGAAQTTVNHVIRVELRSRDREENSVYQKMECFKNLPELLQAITYAKRFLKLRQNQPVDMPITTDELENSLQICIRIVQNGLCICSDIDYILREGAECCGLLINTYNMKVFYTMSLILV